MPADRESLVAALEGLTRLNQRILRAHPEIPDVYAAGIRWTPERRTEQWRSIADVLGFDPGIAGTVPVVPSGITDCEDIASWRTAYLREREGERGARTDVVPGGAGMWHAVVRRADGTIEDPSARLGMPTPESEGADVVGAINWEFHRDPDGRYRGTVSIPAIRFGRDADGEVSVSVSGRTAAEAMRRAASLAGLSMSHPAFRGMLHADVPTRVTMLGRVARIACQRPAVLGRVARRLSRGMADYAEALVE